MGTPAGPVGSIVVVPLVGGLDTVASGTAAGVVVMGADVGSAAGPVGSRVVVPRVGAFDTVATATGARVVMVVVGAAVGRTSTANVLPSPFLRLSSLFTSLLLVRE